MTNQTAQASMSHARARGKLRQMERKVEKGETIFVEGDQPGEMFILLSGKLTIMRQGVKIGAIKDSGVYVGEMSVLSNEPRSATVIAAEDCRLMVIQQKKIQEFLSYAPGMALKLAKILAKRLKRTSDRLATFVREVNERSADC